MADFNIAYRITKENEGGYHNGGGVNSSDLGGETFKGIARRIHPLWPGWFFVDQAKRTSGFPMSALRDELINKMVLEFYKKMFWDVNRLDDLISQPIANELFDTGVNMGTGVASRFLQQGVNYLNRNQKGFRDLVVDGKIGNMTLATVNSLSTLDSKYLFNLLNIMQGARYLEIMDRNPSQEDFIRGWLQRVEIMR